MFIRTNQFRVSSEDLVNATKAIPRYQLQRWLTWFMFIGPWFGALFAMLSRAIRYGEDIGSFIIMWLVAISVLIIIIRFKEKQELQKLHKTGQFDIFHIVELDDEKTFWHTNRGQSYKTYWGEYDKAIKTSELYVLIKNRTNFQWIPLTAFASPEDIYALDSFLLGKKLLANKAKQVRS